MAIKKVPISKIYWEYLKIVEILGTRFGLNENDVVLALIIPTKIYMATHRGFGFTDELGKMEFQVNGVSGKWKFLTCAIVSSDIPHKIPLISVPVRMGA